MNRRDLARNLAVSLTGGAWEAETLTATLLRRLPSKPQKTAARLVSELISAHPNAPAPPVKRVRALLLHAAAFERLYRACHKRQTWPAPDLSAPVMAPSAPFSRLDLPDIATTAALADWLLLPEWRLAFLADLGDRHEDHGETGVNNYHYVLQPKRTGGKRLIEAPKRQLKMVQRRILTGILPQVPVHASALGFVRGRSCLEGAARDAGEEMVLNFDLKDFFPQHPAYARFRALPSAGLSRGRCPASGLPHHHRHARPAARADALCPGAGARIPAPAAGRAQFARACQSGELRTRLQAGRSGGCARCTFQPLSR